MSLAVHGQVLFIDDVIVQIDPGVQVGAYGTVLNDDDLSNFSKNIVLLGIL